MEYKTDEEQSEALKKWLRDNGSSLLTGLLFGGAVLFGGKAWLAYQDRTKDQASNVYSQLASAAQVGEEQMASSQHETLLKESAGSVYSTLAALQMAKLHADKGDLTAAQAQLMWALEHGENAALKDIVRLRIARVLLAQDDYAGAEAQLNAVTLNEDNKAMHAELRGDLALAQQDYAEAHAAYEEALTSLEPGAASRTYLEAKRDDAARVNTGSAS